MSSVNNYMNGIYDNNISCRSCMFCDYVFYNKAKWLFFEKSFGLDVVFAAETVVYE